MHATLSMDYIVIVLQYDAAVCVAVRVAVCVAVCCSVLQCNVRPIP